MEGLYQLQKERVDLVLGNHPNQTGTQEKLDRLRQGEDSILDDTQWTRFLQNTQQRFYDFIRAENQKNQKSGS